MKMIDRALLLAGRRERAAAADLATTGLLLIVGGW